MPPRYLFGPVNAVFAEQFLAHHRTSGDCLAFDLHDGPDLTIAPDDSWEDVCARLPAGWEPDFLALYLPYRTIPQALWQAPVPIVGLVGDWNLLWHYYRRRLPSCELLLVDPSGVDALSQLGLNTARAANIFGCERAYLEQFPLSPDSSPTEERDIDILFVGNFQPAVQRERLAWLGRVAQLADRYRVVLTSHVFHDEYRALLRRAKIVFNRSIRGECNSRVVEATAAGCLLFLEEGNRETPEYFRPGQDYVAYSDANLEALLAHYLDHDEERCTIARSGQARAQECSWAGLWQRQLQLIEAELPQLRQRAAERPALPASAALLNRVWQRGHGNPGGDPTLVSELLQAAQADPRSAELRYALAVALRQEATPQGNRGPILELLQQAVAAEPLHLLAGLALAELLAEMGRSQEAAEAARRTLHLLERSPELSPATLDAPPLIPAFDPFRVEWERCGWAHAGDQAGETRAKRDLLRWRLHGLLSTVTGGLAHFYEAHHARPDLPIAQAALGCALARAGQLAEALPYLRQAVAANPFDLPAARALHLVLGETADWAEQHRLAQDYRRLRQAAPTLVPEQDWFAPAPVLKPHQQPTIPTEAIVWEGAFHALHSLALVNRALCQRLQARGVPLRIQPSDQPGEQSQVLPLSSILTEMCQGLRGPVAVHIRQQWPPNFQAPAEGRLVLIQPWEYGVLPRAWLEPLQHTVAEVWVPSSWVRSCYVRSGVPAEKVFVIPNGVEVEHWQKPRPPFPLRTQKRCRFLFVGGTIHRKGIDLLLTAYSQAFTAHDDVCLVLKDMGNTTFYQGQTAEELIARHRAAGGPEIEHLTQDLSDDELAALYQSCTCLVHPYRGEGFGLPIAEAMACGLPVIVTGYGAALDFCTEENAYLLPARLNHFPDRKLGELEMVERPWLAEPDLALLRHTLRQVFTHPEEARRKGQLGAAHIAAHFTWEQATDAVLVRLEQLCRQPIPPTVGTHSITLLPRGTPGAPTSVILRRPEPSTPAVTSPAPTTPPPAPATVAPVPTATASESRYRVEGFELPLPPAPVARRAAEGDAAGNTIAFGLPLTSSGNTSFVSPQTSSANAVAGTARVSLCMIVKNEEAVLADCLASAADLFTEIIIVDTGSTDRTKEIAARFGAKVIDFTWCDSFAAARNESLRHATGDWIFWLDADERLDEANRQRLRQLFTRLGPDNTAFLMRQFSALHVAPNAAAQVDQVRLFRHHPQIRWQYRVHEQILGSIRQAGGTLQATDIVITHVGYTNPATQGGKLDRNLRLLHLELQERPNDSFVLFYLGAVALEQNRAEEAVGFLQRSWEHIQPTDTLAPKLAVLLVRAHHQLGQRALALMVCRNGRQRFPQEAELLFWEATLRCEQGELGGACQSLEQLLQLPRGQQFGGADAGLQGYRSRHFLADLYRQLDRYPEAEQQWRAALAEAPDFTPAWQGLAQVFLQQVRWDELEKILPRLAGTPEQELVATVLQGRELLARQQFRAVQQLARQCSQRWPQALPPRILLSHALLQEGQDWAAAQQALHEVLNLDPTNAEAARNLQVLLHQQGRAGQSLPGSVSVPLQLAATGPGDGQPLASLVLMVKNEEQNLPRCLGSVAGLFPDIVVIDTGSTDRTREIARQQGARVFDFPWVDSFAAARNEGLRHARGHYVFWLDADDVLDEPNRQKLQRLLASLDGSNVGFVMKCLCLPDPVSQAATAVDHLRLFRRHPSLRWSFRVHEQVLGSFKAHGGEIRWSDVVIQHTGYQDRQALQRKEQRNLRLLQLDYAEGPEHPFTLFNLGSLYQDLRGPAVALPLFQQSLANSAVTDSIVRKLYAQIATCHQLLGQRQQALAACQQGRQHFPEDGELLFHEGQIRRGLGDLVGAENCWRQLLASQPGQHFASVHTGLRGCLTLYHLGDLYREQGRAAEAEKLWLAALEEQPGYEPAWRALQELYIQQQRWPDLEKLTHRLERFPVAAVMVRGSGLLARQEFPAAQTLLGTAVQQHRRSVELRLLWGYAFLQEGKDWAGAERALLAVLELEPHHPEAQRNLALLRRQQGRA